MKQRVIAGILLIVTICIFCARFESEPEAAVRREAPSKEQKGWEYYYSEEMNPFYPELAPYYRTQDGYVTGNCTWYAWGRACEIAGKKLDPVFTGDAGEWWKQNKKEHFYPYGSEPKRGAIICYSTHVGVVEATGPLEVSESGWRVKPGKGELVFNCGTPWRGKEKPLGYIYVE